MRRSGRSALTKKLEPERDRTQNARREEAKTEHRLEAEVELGQDDTNAERCDEASSRDDSTRTTRHANTLPKKYPKNSPNASNPTMIPPQSPNRARSRPRRAAIVFPSHVPNP